MANASKQVVVLIPGLGNTARLWQHQITALPEAAEVLVPDISGCASVAQIADQVLRDSPSSTLSIVGFSLGGYVAFEIARRSPERMTRLALISSSPFPDTAVAAAQRRRLIEKAREDYGSLLEDMAQLVVFPRGEKAAEARACLIDMGRQLGVEEFCRQQEVAMHRPDCTDVLAQIRVPTRIICGRNDLVTPPDGNQFIAERIVDSQIQIVRGAGHLLPLEQPETVARFLNDWLRIQT